MDMTAEKFHEILESVAGQGSSDYNIRLLHRLLKGIAWIALRVFPNGVRASWIRIYAVN
jgi:hypothetical protein